MLRKTAAIFSIVIGTGIIAIWILLLASGSVPETSTAPIQIGVHIFSEYFTASLLLASGTGMLTRKKWAGRLFPVSMGTLMYSVLTGVGLYTQQGSWAMTAMFLAIFALAILFAVKLPAGEAAK